MDAHCLPMRRQSGPRLDNHFTVIPSGVSRPWSFHFWYSSLVNLVNPILLETWTLHRPANLKAERRSASAAMGSFSSFVRMDMITCPISMRAAVPYAFPNAPRIPVERRSAPAQESVLLMRSTSYGWGLIRMWKKSLPALVTMYLFAEMRADSIDSLVMRCFSSDTMCTAAGKSSHGIFFLPVSKILIFGSGTPRQKRDLG
mmetsp:Transcript_141443/g.271417  ORF Transcript_141443/g.271417 Transcript_141443/m.271417 type:complete len:201 (+) Transcript_141443:56-658(+)